MLYAPRFHGAKHKRVVRLIDVAYDVADMKRRGKGEKHAVERIAQCAIFIIVVNAAYAGDLPAVVEK